MKIETAKGVVNCSQGSERKLIEAMVDTAGAINCVDLAAREANAAGVDVRSFDLRESQRKRIRALTLTGKALLLTYEAHAEDYQRAKDLGVDVPRPDTGGR